MVTRLRQRPFRPRHLRFLWSVRRLRVLFRLKGVALAMAPMTILLMAGCDDGAAPTPTLSGSAAEVGFTTEDGVELKGRVVGTGDSGVILAHMFPTDQASWWPFAQVLAGEGYTALTFNFRGYGTGAEKSGGTKEIEKLHLDVKAAVGFLRGLGIAEVALVGASMGGTASLMVATEQSVAAVIGLSVPIGFKGLDVNGERVTVPVLLMVSEGDGSATNSLNHLFEHHIVGDEAEKEVYIGVNDHGTEILEGTYAEAASARILGFLEANRR